MADVRRNAPDSYLFRYAFINSADDVAGVPHVKLTLARPVARPGRTTMRWSKRLSVSDPSVHHPDHSRGRAPCPACGPCGSDHHPARDPSRLAAGPALPRL